MEKRKRYAVVLAGGSGLRAGGDVPKQFADLCGLPVLWWSVKAFHQADPDTRIRIVMHPGFFDLWDVLYSGMPEEEKEFDYDLVCGGRNRLESVKNGIAGIEEEDALIAVHDSARPLVDTSLILRGWKRGEATGAAVPVVAMTDSIRMLLPDGSQPLERSRYVRVQTPQVFEAGLLKRSYDAPLSPAMTDDASVVEAAGARVELYEGSERNMKITHPDDLLIASVLMRKR
ncbi:MAG: 2-C-methyl-D-erythritol 4-phosphate cytidylyltransferase [Muribaculaceae bacterium]|nr:2-C-methyl-D-erythritol 4-phosphate cytidylyltransferase [Muribaculaceae bacterium]